MNKSFLEKWGLLVKKGTLTFIALLLTFSCFSQNSFSSKVISSDKDSIQYAQIAAYSDSLYKKPFFTMQLEKNIFQFEVPDTLSCFYLQITHLNYYTFQRKFCRPLNSNTTITLYKKSNELEEVVINGFKKTKISVTGDVAEIRPGKILTGTKGIYGTNIIKSLPEVFVLPGNKIKIRGRTVQRIYLHLTQNLPATTISAARLEKINAEKILKVAVLYNEAELHVYLKQPKEAGYSIDNQLELNYGRRFYGSFSPDFTLKKGKTTLWFDPAIGTIAQNPTANSTYDVLIDKDEIQRLFSNSDTDRKTRYFASHLLINHNFDSIYTAGVQLDYTIDHGTTKNNAQLTALGRGKTDSYSKDNTNSYLFSPSVYFRGNYTSNWSFTLTSGFSTSLQKKQNLGIFDYGLNGEVFKGSQFLRQKLNTKAYLNELELKKKINSTNLTFDFQHSILDTKTNSLFHQKLIDSETPDSTFNNRLKEKQLRLKGKINTTLFKKYLVNFSTSVVFYNYAYSAKYFRKLFENKTVNWLPNLSISIPTGDTKYLTVFGNTTFRAPNLVNVVFNNLSYDGYVTNKNNLELKPTITYQVGASYEPFKNLNSSVYWLTSKNAYTNYPAFSENGAFEGNRKINLSKNNTLGISLFYSNTFFDKLFLSSNVNINYNVWENSGLYDYSTRFTSLLMNHTFYYSFKNDWNAHLDFTFSTFQKLSNEIALKSYSQMNAGISKTINSHWSVFCNFYNLLNTYKPKLYSLSRNITYNSNIDFDSRYISLGINYNFKKKFKKVSKEPEIMKNLNRRIKIEKDK